MNRIALMGVVVLVGCAEPSAKWSPPEVNDEVRAASLEFAAANPFVFGTEAAFFSPESFRNVPNYTSHRVAAVGDLYDIHYFFKAGVDDGPIRERVEEAVFGGGGCGGRGCTGKVFGHPTPYSQHELNSIGDWVGRSPLANWQLSAQLEFPPAPPEGASASVRLVITTWQTGVEAVQTMLREGGVPADAVGVTETPVYEAR